VKRTSLDDRESERLLDFRIAVRRFLRWSRDQAAASGLTPAQHQVLLMIRVHTDPRGPTIGELASSLLVRHHSAAQLVDRVEELGLVRRQRDADDRRMVRVRLTTNGDRRIATLTATHIEEFHRIASLAARARLATATTRSHPGRPSRGSNRGDQP
jgi:DNA-binding MarR family transcriptional regulator